MKENYILPFLWMRGEKEEIIRDELEKIYECGICAVCVEARPHDDFCGPGWWHDMDIVLDEAKKRGMKIWILDDKHFPTGYANGLIETKYPERKKLYIACTTADVFGGQHPLTLKAGRMLKPSIGYWDLGKPVNEEERGKNQLYGILAVKYAQDNVFYEEVVDLTENYDGTYVSFTLPEGQWRIFVIYKTRTDGGDDTYINLIDQESAHTQIEGVYEAHYERYGQEFGRTIAGFFSDEPQFGNVTAFNSFDTQIGRYPMQLPWSSELQENLEAKYGKELRKRLPFLFVETKQQKMRTQIRYDYMDQVSALYKKNFSDTIGSWCEEHHVEYIGHVVEDNGLHSRLGMGAAHYFRAMSGQHMAGIDCIGGQVIFGAANLYRKGMVDGDGEFYHQVLGKLGASCGHLDPKKQGRTMCELFGAYGWNFGVRDMKYVLDHLLVKGVNYLVPHAFSMAEYPDADCPPHFYARGNHPEFPYFAKLMRYANRICSLLNGGRHIASAAVLYDGEADWLGENMPMQKVCRELLENQIDFDIVSMDMLENLEAFCGKAENGKLQINGVEFDVLVIGSMPVIPQALDDFIGGCSEFPVIFAGAKPEGIIGGGRDGRHAYEACEAVPLEELAETLRKKEFYDISLDQKYAELSFYHYVTDRHVFLFQNESACRRFQGKVMLPAVEALAYYDAMEDIYESTKSTVSGGRTEIFLELEPGECVVILEQKENSCIRAHRPFRAQICECREQDISKNWSVSKVRAIEYPHFDDARDVEELTYISDEYPSFSGIIRYEKSVRFDHKPLECVFCAEHVYEVMRIFINGKEAGFRLFPPYQVSIGDYLKEGENQIVVEAVTTPAREQVGYPRPPFDFSHTALEPSGMSGKISLFYQKEDQII